MRSYETMFIVHPEVVGDDFKALVEKFQGVITERGGEIVKMDEWGSRTLAYPIQKLNKGTYVILYFQADPQVIAELERRMRLDDKVLRFNTLLHEKGLKLSVPDKEKVEEDETAEA